jgi:uncharacterized phage protein (TIGR02220 family)
MSDLPFTHIYERARQRMQITRDEYALANYVQTWAGYPGSSRPGWCDRTLEQKANFIGITPRGLTKMQNRLIEASILEKDPLTSHVRATKVWFEIVHEAKSEEVKRPVPIREQSSHEEGEQSSQKTGNKVPSKKEQSSQGKGNKVPTHNKGFLFIDTEEGKEDIIVPETENPVEVVIKYLNKLTGSSFQTKTDATVKSVNGRIGEGYSVDDIFLVIEYKTAEWLKDPEMTVYLRPSTLFRPSNFENYFQAATKWANSGKPSIVKNGKFPSGNNQKFGADITDSVAGAFN